MEPNEQPGEQPGEDETAALLRELIPGFDSSSSDSDQPRTDGAQPIAEPLPSAKANVSAADGPTDVANPPGPEAIQPSGPAPILSTTPSADQTYAVSPEEGRRRVDRRSRLPVVLAALAALATLVVVAGLVLSVQRWPANGETTTDVTQVGGAELTAGSESDAPQPTETAGETVSSGTPEETPTVDTIDPLTGEPYPVFLDLLTLDEANAGNYPRGIMSTDGTVTLRGRTSSEVAEAQAIAAMEALVGPGQVTSEMEVAPSFPTYPATLIFLDEVVLFESNSIEIDATYQSYLDRIVETLAARPEMRITIIGYADAVGSVQSNLQISRDRAQSVWSYLVDRGVGSDQVSTEARGETARADDQAAEPSTLDRRVEFFVDFDG